VERLGLEADLAARVTRITEQEQTTLTALHSEQLRVDHMTEAAAAAEANLDR
jgi:hypothetical protein